MAQFNTDSRSSTSTSRTAKPSSEFYSVFSGEEIFGIIHALEVRREIPLKYSYKGRGAKIWNDFYLKYIIPTWYRTSNIEINLLKDNFQYIKGDSQNCKKVNIIDVGAGNSYPVREFIRKLDKLGKLNKYVALDISQELLNLSQTNIKKWFPHLKFTNSTIDIENYSIPKHLLKNQDNLDSDTANIILHLGVTIGNHHNRKAAFKNFRDSMDKNDLLVFTNEIGSNSQWNGEARGGCNYHARQIYRWIQANIGINEDCELIRKYDLETDSVVAKIKFSHNYTINFSFLEIDKNVEISKGEEITIWRHHKFEIPRLLQEIEEAGLQLVHSSTNKYSSHIMVICSVAND